MFYNLRRIATIMGTIAALSFMPASVYSQETDTDTRPEEENFTLSGREIHCALFTYGGEGCMKELGKQDAAKAAAAAALADRLAAAADFEPGDNVRLRSGGPVMNVTHIGDDGRVACSWFDEGGRRHAGWFDPRSLKKSGWW